MNFRPLTGFILTLVSFWHWFHFDTQNQSTLLSVFCDRRPRGRPALTERLHVRRRCTGADEAASYPRCAAGPQAAAAARCRRVPPRDRYHPSRAAARQARPRHDGDMEARPDVSEAVARDRRSALLAG